MRLDLVHFVQMEAALGEYRLGGYRFSTTTMFRWKDADVEIATKRLKVTRNIKGLISGIEKGQSSGQRISKLQILMWTVPYKHMI